MDAGVVSHHAARADLIVYLEDDRVAERGSHATLMRAGGRYAALYRLQVLAEQRHIASAPQVLLSHQGGEPEDEPLHASLTARELDVLRLLGQGRANKEIAAELGLGERTARTHVSSILAKLGLNSRTQAALWAVREGLVDVGEPSAP